MAFLSALLGERRRTENRKHGSHRGLSGRASARHHKPTRLVLEPLEQRQLLTVLLSWDPHHTGGVNLGGSGNWTGNNYNGTNANWWDGTQHQDVAWIPGSDAQFDVTGTGTAGPVTLDQAVSADSVKFSASGYTLSDDNTLTLTSSGTAIEADQSATINCGIVLGASQEWTAASGASLTIGGAVNLGSYSLEVDGSAAISGAISGSGNLDKGGTGTLTLHADNPNYKGVTQITGGTLQLGSSGALAASTLDYNSYGGSLSFGTLTAAAFGGLKGKQNLPLANTVNGSVALTVGNNYCDGDWVGGTDDGDIYSGVLGDGFGVADGGGSLIVGGENEPSYTLVLTAANTFTGETSVVGGTLQLGDGTTHNGSIKSETVSLDTTSWLIFDCPDPVNAGYAITGRGDVNQQGAGKVTLAGSSLSLQVITVNTARTLQIGDGVHDATVDISSGGAVWVDGSLIFDCHDSTTVACPIDGCGSVEQKGGGTLTVTGDLAPEGVQIDAGRTLQIGDGVNDGTVDVPSDGTVEVDGSLVFDDSDNTAVNVAISGAGSLIQEGDSTLTLNGDALSSGFSGVTQIENGELQLGDPDALMWSTLDYETSYDGTPGLGTLSFGDQTGVMIGGLEGNKDLPLTNDNGDPVCLTIDGTTTTPYSGVLSGGGSVGTSGWIGRGDLTLSGDNTFRGGLTVAQGGHLELDDNSTQPGTSRAVADSTVWLEGGSITFGPDVTAATFGGLDDESSGLSLTNKSGSGVVLTVGGDGDSTTCYAGISGNGGSLIKVGTGTLTLEGTDTYTGDTTVEQGILQAVTPNALPGYDIPATPAYVVVHSGATLAINVGGTGEWTESETQPEIDTLLSDANFIGNSALGMDTSDASGPFTYGSDIDAPLSDLIKLGSGTLVLSGDNSNFSGAITIDAGTLRVGSDSAFGDEWGGLNGLAVNAGGTLDLNGHSVTVSSLSGSAGGTITDNSGAGTTTFTVFDNPESTTFAGRIEDGASVGGHSRQIALNLYGYGGALILSGSNTYSGGTTINYGATLQVDDGGRAGTAVVTDNGSLVFDVAGTLVVDNEIDGSDASLTKLGSGTLVLGGDNRNFSGAITIDGGTLQLDSSSALGSGSVGLTVNTGGTLDLDGYDTAVGSLSGSGGTITDNSSGTGTTTLTVNEGSGTTTFAGTIEDGSNQQVALTLDGCNSSSTLILSGDNTFSGDTTISKGTLQIGDGGTTGALGSVEADIDSGATLEVATGGTINDIGYRVLDNGSLVFNSSNGVATGTRIAGTGGLTQEGSGTLTLTGPNTYSGGTTISNGDRLVVSEDDNYIGAIGTGNITDNGSLVFNYTMGGDFSPMDEDNAIAGTGSVIQDGSTTVVLSGDNSYSGGTTVDGGTLQLGNGKHALGSGGVTVNTGGTLDLHDYNPTVGPLSGDGGMIENDVGSGAATLTVSMASGTTTYTGMIQNHAAPTRFHGTVGLTLDGSDPDDTLILSGANTYTGGTTVDGGTLQVATPGALPGYSPQETPQPVHVETGATLAVNVGGTGEWAASDIQKLVSPSNSNSQFDGGSALGIDTSGAGGPFTYPYEIDGSLGLTKLGTGTLILGVDNTFSGDTKIMRGVLELDSSGALQDSTLDYSYSGSLSFGSNIEYDYVTFGGLEGSQDLPSYWELHVGGNNAPTTYSGDLAGISTMYKEGTGTLTLDGQGIGCGTLAVDAGTLDITGSFSGLQEVDVNSNGAVATITGDCSGLGTASIGCGCTLDIENGSVPSGLYIENTFGTLIVDSDSELSLDGGSSSGLWRGPSGTSYVSTLIKEGTGPLTLSSDDQWYGWGGIADVQADTLLIVPGAYYSWFDGGITVAQGATLTFDGGAPPESAPVCGGVISGGGDLVKTGAGTLLLTGTNSYTGGTFVENGTLLTESTAALPGYPPQETPLPVTVETGGTLAVAAGGTGEWSQSDIEKLLPNATFDNGSGLEIDTASGVNFSFGGVIGGSLQLAKSGMGTLDLTGNNTYTGGTILEAGTLTLGSTSAIGTLGTITFDGGTLQFSSANSTDYSSRFSNALGQEFDIDTNGQLVTLGSALASSEGTLTKLGAGKLVLTGASTYTGLTTISAGTLQLGDGGTSGEIDGGGSCEDDGSLVFDRSDTVTVGFRIYVGSYDVGDLVQQGTGLLILQSSSDDRLVTPTNMTVSDGTLQVNGHMQIDSTTVDAGTLQVNGLLDLSSDVTNDGTVRVEQAGGITWPTSTGRNYLYGNTTTVSDTAVVIGWTGPSGGAGTTYSIDAVTGSGSGEESQNLYQATTSDTISELMLSQLNPGSQYHLRMTVTNPGSNGGVWIYDGGTVSTLPATAADTDRWYRIVSLTDDDEGTTLSPDPNSGAIRPRSRCRRAPPSSWVRPALSATFSARRRRRNPAKTPVSS